MAEGGTKAGKARRKRRDLSWFSDLAITTGVGAIVSAIVSFKVAEHLARRQKEENDRLRSDRDSLARLMNPAPGHAGAGATKESLAHELELMFEEM